jgi:hypothetical protein
MTENFPDTAEKNIDTTAAWACPTCSLPASMPYCEACGERKPHPHELTLAGLCKQAFEAFTSYDSRLLQTFRKLMFAPGSLTLMYLQGSRKPYLGPFGLFLLANVIFVGMEALAGSNVFSTPLAMQLNDKQMWSFYAEQWVAARMEETQTTLDAYAPIYDQAVAGNSKSFIFLMVLPFAFLASLVFSGQRKPFATHLVYALHYHAFMLMFISFAMFVMWLDLLIGGPGLSSQLTDDIVAFTLLVVCTLYLYVSSVVVYQPDIYIRLFKAEVLIFGAVGVFLGYRFLLFVVTLYTT